MHAFDKLTDTVDGEPRIIADPPLVVPLRGPRRDGRRGGVGAPAAAAVPALTAGRAAVPARAVPLRRSRAQGGRCRQCRYAVLHRVVARHRQSRPAVPADQGGPAIGARALPRSERSSQPRRARGDGQRPMQAASDIFLGWSASTGHRRRHRDFYWRQLRDWKGSVDVDDMHPAMLSGYAGVCGWTLARAHARSGDRVAIAAYLGRSRCSTRRSPTSRRPMPTSTRATTRRSRMPSPTGAYRGHRVHVIRWAGRRLRGRPMLGSAHGRRRDTTHPGRTGLRAMRHAYVPVHAHDAHPRHLDRSHDSPRRGLSRLALSELRARSAPDLTGDAAAAILRGRCRDGPLTPPAASARRHPGGAPLDSDGHDSSVWRRRDPARLPRAPAAAAAARPRLAAASGDRSAARPPSTAVGRAGPVTRRWIGARRGAARRCCGWLGPGGRASVRAVRVTRAE